MRDKRRGNPLKALVDVGEGSKDSHLMDVLLSFLSQPLGICVCWHRVQPPEPQRMGPRFIPETQSWSSDKASSLQTLPSAF